MKRLSLFCLSVFVLACGQAAAQEKAKMRIGTHIAISAHLFMQRKPEVLKNMGKTYEVEIYEGAVHGFLRAQTGRDGANLRATQRAWPRTIAFLRKHTE